MDNLQEEIEKIIKRQIFYHKEQRITQKWVSAIKHYFGDDAEKALAQLSQSLTTYFIKKAPEMVCLDEEKVWSLFMNQIQGGRMKYDAVKFLERDIKAIISNLSTTKGVIRGKG